MDARFGDRRGDCRCGKPRATNHCGQRGRGGDAMHATSCGRGVGCCRPAPDVPAARDRRAGTASARRISCHRGSIKGRRFGRLVHDDSDRVVAVHRMARWRHRASYGRHAGRSASRRFSATPGGSPRDRRRLPNLGTVELCQWRHLCRLAVLHLPGHGRLYAAHVGRGCSVELAPLGSPHRRRGSTTPGLSLASGEPEATTSLSMTSSSTSGTRPLSPTLPLNVADSIIPERSS